HIILKKRDKKNKYLYGVCDRNFNTIVPIEYNSFEKNVIGFGERDDWSWDVKNYIVSKEGKYGILDTLFTTILPLQYDAIEVCKNTYIVRLNYKYGVLDSDFSTLLPVEFDWIYATYIDDDHDNNNYIVKKDHVQKLYDEKGRLISDFYIEKRDREYDDEKDEYVEKSAFEPVFEPNKTTLSAYIEYYLDGYYGIIDDATRVVIPAKYDKIEYLGNGNFACIKDESSFLIKDKK
ncbi:MAG: WG repeat-containing protein, partial [Odoribacteraceae bacterium]|nr:WG repeat-containing protein [Odoribacteraceae bacterium]